jgi:hypothetical protein
MVPMGAGAHVPLTKPAAPPGVPPYHPEIP